MPTLVESNYSPSGSSATQFTDDADDADDVLESAGAGVEIEPLRASVPADCGGERLDKVLARLFPAYSRSRLQAWTDDARVTLDGRPARTRQRVAGGEQVVVRPQVLPEQHAFAPEPVPLSVVYEDAYLAVLDKPAGRVVHPAAGNWSGTLLNGLLHRYGAEAAALPRAGIVHRLDKDTSGLMVVARTLPAQTDLVRQLQARTVKRYYVAVAWGALPARGVIDAPIGRDPRERVRMAVVQGATGKPARTHFVTLATGRCGTMPVSLVCCALETGRTHQIRVHLAHLGHPLLGDPLYRRGVRQQALPVPFARQALHAWQLGLMHPHTGQPMRWQSPLPQDMRALLDALDMAFEPNPQVFADDDIAP